MSLAARVAVELDTEGAVRCTELSPSGSIAPRPVIAGDAVARVALVGVSMMLLDGDDVRIEVEVGAGAVLEIVEPAALVAHRGRASWTMRARVGRGGTLLYAGSAFVVAYGADASRTMDVGLEDGARSILRETLVLGRSGEAGGRVVAATRVVDPDGELLVERLEGGTELGRLPGLLGSARVVDAVSALGWTPDAPPRGPAGLMLELESGGRIARLLGTSAAQLAPTLDGVYGSWRDEILASTGSARAPQPA